MNRPPRFLLALACLGIAIAIAAPAADGCVICTTKGNPLHREFALAPIVAFGYVSKSQLGADGVRGTSELQLEAVLKDSGGALKGKNSVTVYRYVPPNPKIKYLVLADVVGGQVDLYRTFTFSSDRVVAYLKGAPTPPAPGGDARKWLLYHFDFLNDAEPEIAADAFNVWANATNQEVSAAAAGLPPEKLRNWLLDPKTPPERLGLYAFLLGACGKETEADLLRRLIQHPDERVAPCMDGLLGGYISLRPAEGWKLAKELLADPHRPFTQKHATLRILRFFHSVDAAKNLEHIADCLAILARDPNHLDQAADQLRQWKLWGSTDELLQAFGTEKAKAPISKRALVRYAISCPQPAAKRFIEELKKKEPKLVADVEEELPLFDEPIKP